jgi:hypothetical protein
MITIAVVNESTVVNGSDLPAVIAALQKQVEEHFWPAWGLDAELELVASAPRDATAGGNPGKGAPLDPTWWQLIILDDSDQADALGYHETTAAGLPLGKIFAKTTMQDGGQWTVTASHELLEMLVDPEINLSVFVQDSDATSGKLYAYEVCDAVENATYVIDGVMVSDFVLPSYFEPGTVGVHPAAPFDFLKQLAMPLPALLPGGYLSVFQVGAQSQGWTQITDMRARARHMMPAAGSRRHRRMLPRGLWRRSVIGVPARPIPRAASAEIPSGACGADLSVSGHSGRAAAAGTRGTFADAAASR